MDREEAHLADPLVAVAGDRVADRETGVVFPVPEPPDRRLVEVVGPEAVDVDAATVEAVEGDDDVLQGRLQVLVHVVGLEGRITPIVDVPVDRPLAIDVLVETLTDGEVRVPVVARVGNDARGAAVALLGRVARHHPRLDGVLARAAGRRGDAVVELGAVVGVRDGALAFGKLDPVAAHPLGARREIEIDRRRHVAAVEGRRTGAFLEVPLRDDVGLDALAAFVLDAVGEGEGVAHEERDVDARTAARDTGVLEHLVHRVHRGEHLGAVGGTTAPAVVEVGGQAPHQPRRFRKAEVHLLVVDHGRERHRDVAVGDVRRAGAEARVAVVAVRRQQRVDRALEGADLLALAEAAEAAAAEHDALRPGVAAATTGVVAAAHREREGHAKEKDRES